MKRILLIKLIYIQLNENNSDIIDIIAATRGSLINYNYNNLILFMQALFLQLCGRYVFKS